MSWIRFHSPEQSLKITQELACVCSELGGPYAKKLYSLLASGRVSDLINHKFDYSDPLLDVNDVLYARQIHALVAKQDYIDIGIDKEQVAFSKFLESEEKCRKTNEIFESKASLNKDTKLVLHYASRKIAQILGDCPPLSSLDFSFGPGATTSTKKAFSHPLMKLKASLTCSRELASCAGDLMSEVPHWRSYHTLENKVRFSFSHSKLVFVPKDSRTFRSIGIEPLLNGFFQKGIGSYLKRRLKMFGVDLSDQSRNQRMAEEASIHGNFATIDLASASDTISYMVVLDLLPFDWFLLLEKFRSSTVLYKDTVYNLERFSSMGNAYTFELESLIFYSLCWGVCKVLDKSPDLIGVYGDDLIVESGNYDLLRTVLEDCGFTVNSEKSFRSGPFRESCGADYFRGCDIRPFYQKTLISGRTLFVAHNWFLRRGEIKLAETVKSFIPNWMRLFGPDGYGDGHLIGSYHLRRNRKIRRLGYEGGFFDTYTLNPRRFKYSPEVPFVYPLYCTYVSDQETEMDHSILPGTVGYKRISLYILDRSVFRRPIKRV
jgi:hypothetical protein